eukprot:g25594.t1
MGPLLLRYGFSSDKRGSAELRAVIADLANQNKEIRMMNMDIQKLVISNFPDLKSDQAEAAQRAARASTDSTTATEDSPERGEATRRSEASMVYRDFQSISLAVLVLAAYQSQLPVIKELVTSLWHSRHSFLIHVDQKFPVLHASAKDWAKGFDNIYVRSEVSVKRSGASLLAAEIYGITEQLGPFRLQPRLGAMAHKSNPYKKARSKFRWKWKKILTLC